MKKILAAALLCCLFFIVIGHYVVFRIQLSEIKTEMKKELQHSLSHRVTIFTFEKKELAALQWEDRHEFRFHGEMYDLIDLRRENGKYIIRCIQDKKEKELLEAYQKLAHKTSGSPCQASLLKLLLSDFINTELSVLNRPQKHVETGFAYSASYLQEMNPAIPEQPPRSCLFFC